MQDKIHASMIFLACYPRSSIWSQKSQPFFWFWFSISTHAYDILPKSEIIINLFLHKLVYLHYWNEKEWTSNTGSNMDETKMHYKKAT